MLCVAWNTRSIRSFLIKHSIIPYTNNGADAKFFCVQILENLFLIENVETIDLTYYQQQPFIRFPVIKYNGLQPRHCSDTIFVSLLVRQILSYITKPTILFCFLWLSCGFPMHNTNTNVQFGWNPTKYFPCDSFYPFAIVWNIAHKIFSSMQTRQWCNIAIPVYYITHVCMGTLGRFFFFWGIQKFNRMEFAELLFTCIGNSFFQKKGRK